MKLVKNNYEAETEQKMIIKGVSAKNISSRVVSHKLVHSVVFLRPYTTSFKVKYSLDQSRTFKGPL